MNNNLKFNELLKFGFVSDKLPSNIFNELIIESQKVLKDFKTATKVNHRLAGAIQHEYILPLSEGVNKVFLNYLNNKIIPFYIDQNKDFILKDFILKNKKFKFHNTVWVNFMSKNEYNPLHSHSGLLSFVIWVNIPYNIDNEMDMPQVKLRSEGNNNLQKPGLSFSYTSPAEAGGVVQATYEVNKDSEGEIILFPSYLKHCVYPFYTGDEYRVSISGNLILED